MSMFDRMLAWHLLPGHQTWQAYAGTPAIINTQNSPTERSGMDAVHQVSTVSIAYGCTVIFFQRVYFPHTTSQSRLQQWQDVSP